MKIVCLQKNIQKGLNVISRSVGKNSTLPVLENILLKTKNGFLEVSATNLEIGISYWIPAKIEKEGSVVIPYKIFSGFISNLPNDKVFLSKKNNSLSVKSINCSATINSGKEKEFPIIPNISGGELFSFSGRIISDLLGQAVVSASISESRPEINGVFIKVGCNRRMIVAATDGFRLIERTIKFEGGTDCDSSFILPLRSAQEVVRIFNENDNKVIVVLDKNQVIFKTSGGSDDQKMELVSRLVDGKFPDYSQLIPKDFKTKIVLNGDSLLSAVKVGGVFSGKINDIKLKVSVDRGEITVSSNNFDYGENNSTVKVDVSGSDIEIVFNYKYIIDCLNAMNGSGDVFIGLNDQSGPVLFRPYNSKDYIHIVMPIRS